MYTYRYSRNDDYTQINNLLCKCFGEGCTPNALDNLDNRYLLALHDNNVVALSGINYYQNNNNRLEVDWTCVDPLHRKKGIVSELLRRLLSTVKSDVYCSCWRLPGNDINLVTAMKTFNFECIHKGVIKVGYGINCGIDYEPCNLFRGNNCHCYEDLYLRKYS